jgi:hypothetical protein
MFKDPRGVSKSVASPTPQEDVPEHLVSSLVRLRASAADANALDEWLDELLTAALSRSSDDEVREVLLAAGPGALGGALEGVAQEVLAVVRARLGDLQASIETLESCQDLLESD